MPVTHEVVDGLVLLTAEGHVSNAEFVRCFRRMGSDPLCAHASGMIIIDEHSDYAPTPEETKEAAVIMKGFQGTLPTRVAVVVGSDMKYGFGRMVSAYCDAQGVTVEVFRNLTEARAWIGES